MRKIWISILLLFPSICYVVFWLVVHQSIYYIPNSKDPYAVIFWNNANLSSEVSVFWETEYKCTGVINITKHNTQYSYFKEENSQTIYHKIILLKQEQGQQDQKVNCKEIAIPQSKMTFTFIIFDNEAEEKTLLVIGDVQSQQGMTHNQQVFNAINKFVSEYIPLIIVGDFVWEPQLKAYWNLLFKTAKQTFQNKTIIPIVGNHDVEQGQNSNEILGLQSSQFGLPNEKSNEFQYSFEQGNSILICLSWKWINQKNADNVEFTWLKKVLENTAKQAFRIVILHRNLYPLFTLNSPPAIINDLIEIFDQYNVNLVIHGHVHAQIRWNMQTKSNKSIPIICVGGGGGQTDMIQRWYTANWFNTIGTTQAMNTGPIQAKFNIKNNFLRFYAQSPWGSTIDHFILQSNASGSHQIEGLVENNSSRNIVFPTYLAEINILTCFVLVFNLFWIGLQFITIKKDDSLLEIISNRFSDPEYNAAPKTKYEQVKQVQTKELNEVSKTEESFENNMVIPETNVEDQSSRKQLSNTMSYHWLGDSLLSCFLASFSGFLAVQIGFSLISFFGIFAFGIQGYNNIQQFVGNQIIMVIVPCYFLIVCFWFQPRINRVIFMVALFIFSFIQMQIIVVRIALPAEMQYYYFPLVFGASAMLILELISMGIAKSISKKAKSERLRKWNLILFGNIFKRNPENKLLNVVYSDFAQFVLSALTICECCLAHFGYTITTLGK